MTDNDDLRAAVLSALIGAHGPLHCIHVARVRTFKPFECGERPSALGGGQVSKTHFCAEASELRLVDGAVVLELPELERPLYAVGEPKTYASADDACKERDRLCEALGCLPWDRTPLGRPLTPDDATAALRHVQASSEGVKILPGSTSEISGWTFRNHTESTPDKAERGTI